jgi:Zn-finger nucleic acid-binding protein
MICPNDNTMMHQATLPAHYGQKVVIDQCGDCGGLWFDALELYKTQSGAGESIEKLDTALLRSPTEIDHSTLLCPRDKTILSQFNDSRFPKEILLMRCEVCQGFWLNRGEFSKYQESRRKLIVAKEKPPEDEHLGRQVKQLLASDQTGNYSSSLASAGAFLSTPVSLGTSLPRASNHGLVDEGSNLSLFLNVLIAILRIFVFRH